MGRTKAEQGTRLYGVKTISPKGYTGWEKEMDKNSKQDPCYKSEMKEKQTNERRTKTKN